MKMTRNTQRLTLIGIMAAIGVLLYFVAEIPIVPGVPHLKIDLSDLPAILAALTAGPIAGIAVEVVKNVIHLAASTTFGIGEIMNVLVGSSLVLSLTLFYRLFCRVRGKAQQTEGTVLSMNAKRVRFVIAAVITTAVTIVIGYAANLIFTPIYCMVMGWPCTSEVLWGMVLGSTTLNAVKSAVCCIPSFFLLPLIERFRFYKA